MTNRMGVRHFTHHYTNLLDSQANSEDAPEAYLWVFSWWEPFLVLSLGKQEVEAGVSFCYSGDQGHRGKGKKEAGSTCHHLAQFRTQSKPRRSAYATQDHFCHPHSHF